MPAPATLSPSPHIVNAVVSQQTGPYVNNGVPVSDSGIYAINNGVPVSDGSMVYTTTTAVPVPVSTSQASPMHGGYAY